MKSYKSLLIILIFISILPFPFLLIELDFSTAFFSNELFEKQLFLTLGSIFGFIGTILFLWGVFLGSRFLVKLFTNDVLWVNKVHNWLGKYGIILIALHPIFILLGFANELHWTIFPNVFTEYEIFVSFGRMAFLLYLVIWLTSAILKDRMKFRPWLYIHYITYPIIILAIIHAINVGTFVNEFVYLLYIWYILLFLTVGLTILRILQFSGLLSHIYIIKEIVNLTEDLVQIKISPKSTKNILEFVAGQYVYLQLNRFGETHPFSVMFKEDNGDLYFVIKKIGNFTKKITEITIENEVFLDGPYGVFTDKNYTEESNQKRIYLAGGVGITPFIQRILTSQTNENNYLFYSNRYYKEIIFGEKLHQKLGVRFINCISKEGSSDTSLNFNIVNSRVSFELIQKSIKSDINDYSFFVCGSRDYITGIESMLLENGISKERIYSEKFF